MVEVRFINDTTPIEVTSDEQETQIGVVSETQTTEIQVGGLTHADLSGRDSPDQHPISAITGLQEALDTIPTDYVSDAELESALLEKQDVLTAGANVQINGNVISATDTTYTAGTGISIIGNVISNTQTSAEWGNITGTLSAQTDLWNVLNAKANVADIPTTTSDLTNDSGFITSAALTPYATQTWVENKGYITSSALTPYALISSLAPVATSGSYSDLTNKPTIPAVNNATLTIQKNSSDIDTFTANASVDKIINITVPTTASEVSALPDSTKYGASIDLSLDTTNYKLTLTLKDQDGTTLNSKVVDFPIESVVVNGSYDALNQKIVLTLQNGNTIDIPVGALIAGLQTEITVNNKLDADLVDDNTSTNKFVTSNEKTSWDSKQDAISDLSTIRSNATNGASAYTTIQSYGNIVTHNVSEFATSAQGTLADSAVQPADLATVATSGSYNDLTDKPTIPAATSDLTNDSGFITSSALNGYATESWVGQQGYITGITSSDVTTALGYTPYNSSNPSGYITSSALTPYALSADLATVATSGSYNDLSNKPTNMVTTDTAQDITGIKTFVGEKRIKFKQSLSADKLGFTLYAIGNTELGAFEYRPNTINGGAFININTSKSSTTYVGFRYWNSVNIIAPKPSNGNYFITIGVTDGTNTVYTQTDTGVINISTLLPTVPTNVSAFTNDAGYITSSALNGYATESWVGQQGYITGITSSDVTTALGYTPYDASNPSGYTSNVGTVTSVNNTSPDSNGNVAITIPAAQVNSDWNAVSGVAQILNKPTLATVATTGAYSDLSGTPSLSGYQTTANLVTSISSLTTDSQYPSAKCVYDIIGDVETLLSQV